MVEELDSKLQKNEISNIYSTKVISVHYHQQWARNIYFCKYAGLCVHWQIQNLLLWWTSTLNQNLTETSSLLSAFISSLSTHNDNITKRKSSKSIVTSKKTKAAFFKCYFKEHWRCLNMNNTIYIYIYMTI